MGNRLSRPANFERLGEVISTDSKYFKDRQERTEWMNSVLSVLTNNRPWTGCDYDYRMVYLRNSQSRFVAQLLAVDHTDGVIKMKIDPEQDGKDRAEAFNALKRHVEQRMDALLANVPNALHLTSVDLLSNRAQLSPPTTTATTPASSAATEDEPPSYEQGAGLLAGSGKNH